MDVDTSLRTKGVGIVACANFTVHTDSADEAQVSAWTQTHFFLHRNRRNDHEQPRSVPLIPMLFGGG